MTFDSQVASTWEGALIDLRDKVSGMAGWSVADASLTGEGYFVLEAPAWDHMTTTQPNADQLAIGSGSIATDAGGNIGTNDQLFLSEGHSWEVTNNYEFDRTRRGATVRIDDTAPDPTDDVEYWLSYAAETGFAFYVRRVQGDGNDGAGFIGYNRLDPANTYWDVYGANSQYVDRWSAGVIAIWGAANDYGDPFHNRQDALSPTNMLNQTDETWYQQYHLGGSCFQDGPDGNGMVIGGGLLNPDDNFSNYVWTSTVVSNVVVENTESGRAMPVGELYHHYMRDESRSDLNTGDIIQDGAGNDEFEIVDYHGGRVAMRAV